MRLLWRNLKLRWLVALALCAAAMPIQSAQWLPGTAQELQMTDEPQAPKASAIFLYRQVDRDDNISEERDYLRMKILTEEDSIRQCRACFRQQPGEHSRY
jgi:hypothetical protein